MYSFGHKSGGLKSEQIVDVQPIMKEGMLRDRYAVAPTKADPVSKTGGRRFEPCHSCQLIPTIRIDRQDGGGPKGSDRGSCGAYNPLIRIASVSRARAHSAPPTP